MFTQFKLQGVLKFSILLYYHHCATMYRLCITDVNMHSISQLRCCLCSCARAPLSSWLMVVSLNTLVNTAYGVVDSEYHGVHNTLL